LQRYFIIWFKYCFCIYILLYYNMIKSTQIFFRLSKKEKKIIEKGAKLDRRSTSDFIRLSSIDRAMELIENEKKREGEMITLSGVPRS